MRDLPKLKLMNGEEVTLTKPTMKMWLRVAEYDNVEKDEWPMSKLMAEHAKVIAEMYGLETIDDIDPADVLTGYVEAAKYILGVATEKLHKLPKNVETEEEQ